MDKTQDVMYMLNHVMNQEELKTQLHYSFGNFNTTKVLVLVMKIYHYLDTCHLEKYNTHISVSCLHKYIIHILKDTELMSYLVEHTLSYMNDENVYNENKVKKHICSMV